MRLPRFLRPSPFRVTRTALRELILLRKAVETLASLQAAAWAEAHPQPRADADDGSAIAYRDNVTTAELIEVEADLVRQYGRGRVSDEMVVAEWEARQR
jgi:hypothetical protein